jgi:hypothetical protein
LTIPLIALKEQLEQGSRQRSEVEQAETTEERRANYTTEGFLGNVIAYWRRGG